MGRAAILGFQEDWEEESPGAAGDWKERGHLVGGEGGTMVTLGKHIGKTSGSSGSVMPSEQSVKDEPLEVSSGGFRAHALHLQRVGLGEGQQPMARG